MGIIGRVGLLFVLSLCAATHVFAREAVIATTIRELNAHPEKYLRKKVQVVGYVQYLSAHAIYETLEDFRVMATLDSDHQRVYPGAVSFRGGEDWLRAPQFAHRRAKIVVEGYFTAACAPNSNVGLLMTCHDAITDTILVDARIVELLAPGEAFSDAPADAKVTAKPTPLEWPDYGAVKALAIKMVDLLQAGKWNEFLAQGSGSSRDAMNKAAKETAPSGLSWPDIYAETFLEVTPRAPGAVMLFNDWSGETTRADGTKINTSFVTACFCLLKHCDGKWPSERDELLSSGRPRRQLPFTCQEFEKEGDQLWRWSW